MNCSSYLYNRGISRSPNRARFGSKDLLDQLRREHIVAGNDRNNSTNTRCASLAQIFRIEIPTPRLIEERTLTVSTSRGVSISTHGRQSSTPECIYFAQQMLLGLNFVIKSNIIRQVDNEQNRSPFPLSPSSKISSSTSVSWLPTQRRSLVKHRFTGMGNLSGRRMKALARRTGCEKALNTLAYRAGLEQTVALPILSAPNHIVNFTSTQSSINIILACCTFYEQPCSEKLATCAPAGD